MKSHTRTLTAIAAALAWAVLIWAVLAGTDARAADGKPADKPADGEKPELLSDHKTVAKLVGITDRKCRGLTALCPDRCGHSGRFATFQIVAYLDYQKPGQYGDPKATEFMFQIDDNHKASKIPADLAQQLADLKPGDFVLLDWRHDYVTRFEGGGSTSSPERPVTKLEKISKEQANKAARKS